MGPLIKLNIIGEEGRETLPLHTFKAENTNKT